MQGDGIKMHKKIWILADKLEKILNSEITRKRFLVLSTKFVFLTFILSLIPIKWSKEPSPMSRMRKKIFFSKDMYLKHTLAG